MDSIRSETPPLSAALIGSATADVMLLCDGGLSDDDVNAVLAWQAAAAGGGRRTLTLVKSPMRAACDLVIRGLSASSTWVVQPVSRTDPELRLRCSSPDLRVTVVFGSRRLEFEMTALANGSLLYRV